MPSLRVPLRRPLRAASRLLSVLAVPSRRWTSALSSALAVARVVRFARGHECGLEYISESFVSYSLHILCNEPGVKSACTCQIFCSQTQFCQHFFLPPVKTGEDRNSNPPYGFGCGRGTIFGTTFQEPSSLQWAEAQILKSLFSFRTTSSRGYAFGTYLLYPTPIQAPIFGPERT